MLGNLSRSSKPRYEILDGLRGVAALIVVAFHMFETYRQGYETQIITHGFLAVDFFFVLSGFVTGYAYDDRWNRLTNGEFFKRRLVRLHPMVIFSVIIGAAFYFFQGYYSELALRDYGWIFFIACIVTDLFLIPTGKSIDIRGWGEITSFNGPSWSLMFEYIGNILYATVFRHLNTSILILICLVSSFFTMDLALGWDIFNLFAEPKYNLIGGWVLDAPHMYTGFVRLLFSYVCGLVLARYFNEGRFSRLINSNLFNSRHLFLPSAIAIIVILSFPCVGGKEGVLDGMYQCLAVFILFPTIVVLGVLGKIDNPLTKRICLFLGEISYPLYIVHYPVAMLQFKWIRLNPEAPLWMHIGVFLSVYVISIILAIGASKFFDSPIRSWLKKVWLKQ